MIITSYGLSAIRLEAKGTVLAIDPYEKDSGLPAPRFEAAVVLATNPQYEKSSIAGNPYVISGPGEYDIKGITVEGAEIASDHTAYVISWDDLVVMHLGEFTNGNETDVERILKNMTERVHVLFVPVGGELSPKSALAIINMINPAIAVPTNYLIKGMSKKLGKLSDFVREAKNPNRTEDKLSIKSKDLQSEDTEIIVLNAPYAPL